MGFLIGIIVLIGLGFVGAPFWVWVIVSSLLVFGAGLTSLIGWGLWAVIAVVFCVPALRRLCVSGPVMNMMIKYKFLPQISSTEQEAIDAGTVWVDKELFSGKPDFKRILKESYPVLTEEERAFLEGPVETVCQMVDPWKVSQKRDFSPEVWDFLKKERFFGMVIPKSFGGLEFSAFAHSAVISKLASRSISLAITVMVPNSLGPGELLTHYGTGAQKSHYLPRLAVGEDIPCFALTEPEAGSDAGSIQASGVVFKGEDGALYMRLNWKKRWITLAAISTVMGVAFKLKDPENLLGHGESLGITCALVKHDTPGVVLGRRHDPLGIPFYNCPTEGHDVVLPIDDIIGGREWAGQGWRMLMESLSAGRGISLPSNSAGGAKLVSRVAGSFAAIRQQFGMSIGKFEGIEEPLARIAGYTYILDAMRTFTCGALDMGSKPAVVTAIAKYNATELFRKVINDGMDILGGAGISEGPRNLLAEAYRATPIGITVEGANILTRTLIIFGQGAIRCHPFVIPEIKAIESRNVAAFDVSFFGHVGHVVRNKCRAIVLTLSRGRGVSAPVMGPTARYYQKLSWVSAVFAIFADVALATLGANLKRKEKLAGRFSDVLSWMYMATAVLRRYEAEGRLKEDLPLVHWSVQHALSEIQTGLLGICANMTLLRPMGWLLRVSPVGCAPSDALGGEVAALVQVPGAQRDRLTQDIYRSTDETDAMGRMDAALSAVHAAIPVARALREAMHAGKLEKSMSASMLERAVALGIISSHDVETMKSADRLRKDAIQVDDFSLEGYLARD